MPNFELEFSPHKDRPFQQIIEYLDPSTTPVEVSRMTATILDRFFAGLAQPWELRRLANDAVNLTYLARKGFLNNMYLLRNLGRINPESLDTLLLQMNRQYSEESSVDEETEAFSRMYIAFGILPEFAKQEGLPRGFSKRGVLQCPFTTEELYGRIVEVGSEIQSVSAGRVPPSINLISRPSLLRTYWTFHAMGFMPTRTIESGTVSGIAEETLENLATRFQNPQDR